MSDVVVTDNPAESRYEARIDGVLAGVAEYHLTKASIVFTHTEVLDGFEGKGVGSALIHGVYERAKLAGSPRVYWQTHETNLTAQSLYDKVAERSGFIVYRKLF